MPGRSGSPLRPPLIAVVFALALTGCGGSSSSSSTVPAQGGTARVRFVDGAPSLETLIGGVPQPLCPGASAPCYLQVGKQTVTNAFYYSSMTSFLNVNAGTLSLVARVEAGYAVGPLTTTALSPGKSYTLVVVGSYPKYQVLSFEEPPSSGSAALSLYNAAPSKSQTSFGTFRASNHSNFTQRGKAAFGELTTVSLGKSVSDVGGYVGNAGSPLGTVTPSQIDVFDKKNALPFHNIARLSLFLFDSQCASCSGPVFGSLDR